MIVPVFFDIQHYSTVVHRNRHSASSARRTLHSWSFGLHPLLPVLLQCSRHSLDMAIIVHWEIAHVPVAQRSVLVEKTEW
jgi:hypothetical protein